MNRRGFLSLLAPAAAVLVAPELLIPKRTFFLPPAGGWRPGMPMTATEIVNRALLAMGEDLAVYGSSLTELDFVTGRIHRVPPQEWQQWPSGQRVTTRVGLPAKYFKSL